jgi:hypothetical protein
MCSASPLASSIASQNSSRSNGKADTPWNHVDVTFSRDGELLAAQLHDFLPSGEFARLGRVMVWDTADPSEPVFNLVLPQFSHVALSPRGHRLLRRVGIELLTDQAALGFRNSGRGARVTFQDGHVEEAGVVTAADGLHSVAHKLLVDDQPVNSAYVAYRGAMPIEQAATTTSPRGTSCCTPVRSATSCSTGGGGCSTVTRS